MSFIWDHYLDGSLENYKKVMSEKTLDDVISLLNLDPDQIIDHESGRNLKESLWSELATIIYVWGRPSETILETSPKHLFNHFQKIEKSLSNTLEIIEKIESNTQSIDYLKTKEMIVAELIQNNADNDDIFIDELNQLKELLRKFLKYTNNTANDLKNTIKERGTSKPAKDRHDDLIWELCKVYKRYTGKQPVSWNTGTSSPNPNQFTGDILYFLQGVLSNSFYSGEIGEEALQKKLYRMSKQAKYEALWQDTKE